MMAEQQVRVDDMASGGVCEHKADEISGAGISSLREAPSASPDDGLMEPVYAGSMGSVPQPFGEHANGLECGPKSHVPAPGVATLTSRSGRRVLHAKRWVPKIPEEVQIEVANLTGESFKLKVKPTCTLCEAKKAIATVLGLAGVEQRIANDGNAYTLASFRKFYGSAEGDVKWDRATLMDERHYEFGLVDSCQLANLSTLSLLSDCAPLFIGRRPVSSTDAIRLTMVLPKIEVAQMSGEVFAVETPLDSTVRDLKRVISDTLGLEVIEKRRVQNARMVWSFINVYGEVADDSYTRADFVEVYGEGQGDEEWNRAWYSSNDDYQFHLVDACESASPSPLSDDLPVFVGAPHAICLTMVR
jgi:hypothetical protein